MRGAVMTGEKTMVDVKGIEESVKSVRGQKVMLDTDLAGIYQVETKVLMQAVRRNIERFPEDFMFQLTFNGADASRSQNVTLKRGQNIKYLPHAFTEQGVAMLSSELRSKRAIQVNIEIMRFFVQMKRLAFSHSDLGRRLDTLEKKYDGQFKVVFDAIRQLMTPTRPKRKQIGFHWEKGSEGNKSRAGSA